VEGVRLIGVDIPETVDPEEDVEPYGPQASDFATSELEGERVSLEFGKEKIDQYDRLLAYVYIDGQMFNEELVEELVEQGYAQAYPYEPNTKYSERFEETQQEARASDLGIWGLSLQEQCQLANHGNGIGEGSAGCEDVADGSASATSSATTSATATASASATAKPSGGVPPISEQDCPPSARSRAMILLLGN
jgi:micrococcal nuclease